MKEQSYASHGHHPVPTYIAGTFALVALALLLGVWLRDQSAMTTGMLALALAVAALVSISRTYIVRLQDRIILLEMKVRCAEVLPAGQDARLNELRTKQVVALRFASDAELGELLDRAIREQLSPADIKKAITHWRPDYLRT